MASFLTDWLKIAVGIGDFSWYGSDVACLLIATDPDYDPLPSPSTVDGLVVAELAVAGYARQALTSRAVGGDLLGGADVDSTWLTDTIVFPGLAPCSIRGAWLFDDRGDDSLSPLVAFLDLGDVGTSGDFRIAFTDATFVNVSSG